MIDDSDWSTVFREIKEIKGSLLKQVLAAMGINHTVMNPGWVTAHQRTHEGPSVHERDPLMWGIALFRFINCVIGNEGNLKYID